MDTVRDFTKGPITKAILAFYFPMFVTNLLQQFYSFADAAIVGNGLGDNALAAIGNMSSINFLIIGFSFGLSAGFAILIAQFFGAKNYDALKRALAGSISLAIIIAIILTLFSNCFLSSILNLLQTDPVIINDSLKYGHIIFCGLSATIAYNLSSATLRSFGDSQTPLKAIIASTIINIALDYILIFIVKTGVEGAAYATIFSQIVSALICIRKLTTIEYAKISMQDFINAPSLYISLLKCGIPMAVMNSITAIGCMVVQYFVNGNGVAYTAAYSACSRYINLFMQPACTSGHAMSAYTSQNYGARRFDRIQRGMWVCLAIAFVSYITLGTVMVTFPRQLADIFLTSSESIELTMQYLKICGVGIVIVDCMFVFRMGAQAMGRQMIPMISGVAEMILRIGIIVLFSRMLGFRATAVAEIAAWSGALIMNMTVFIITLYREKRTVPAQYAPE